MSAFLGDFDVTWARREQRLGSEFSVYFLKPESEMGDAFGFNAEILAVYSPYRKLEPRALLNITEIMEVSPAKGRVDPTVVFLISDADDPVGWVAEYVAQHADLPLVAAFRTEDLLRATDRGDTRAVRRALADQLYGRDLFAQDRRPIKSDSFFFGRTSIVRDLTNAYRYSEDRGLFGLRKSGKTSIFLKVQRVAETQRDVTFVLIDCKLPAYRNLRWRDLLQRVAREIVNGTSAHLDETDLNTEDAFAKAVRNATASGHLILVFDEVENITPLNSSDLHWKNDFVPFWQTVLHAKDEVTSLSIFLGGINATIVEKSEFDGVQNPLFTVFAPQYVAGMTKEEIGLMVQSLGNPMGLNFDDGAVGYLRKQYGGHPQLTKEACSITYRMLRESGKNLPVDVNAEFLRETEQERSAELSDHASLVLSELEKFYPTEFDLLSLLAAEDSDFYDFVSDSDPEYNPHHLKSYGLLETSETGRLTMAIDAIGRSLRSRKRGARAGQPLTPFAERPRWLRNRTTEIDRLLKQLEQEIHRTDGQELFGSHYYDSYGFRTVSVVENKASFVDFINTLYKCFVEPLLKKSSGETYLDGAVSAAYPDLAEAINRIRSYRHYTDHTQLKPLAAERNREFLRRDLGNPGAPSSDEQWFKLQERTLDEMRIAIVTEVDRLS